MKKILITGKNSYIGKSLEKWLGNHPESYKVDSISVREDSWKEKDFSGYDVVLHLAGIAHVSTDPKMEELYYKVNRDLTIEAAVKAKADGVKQFIFMSSIIVYGDSSSTERIITRGTIPTPSNFYGHSKLQAEEGISKLQTENFKVVIIRPPMIYGKGSKGNYPKLAKLARKTPIFPDIENQRSMLYIDNFSEFLKLMIDNEESGLFFPQNKEYVKTKDMVRLIAEAHGKKIGLTRVLNPLLKAIGMKLTLISKVFGNLVYEKSMSEYKTNYRIRGLKKSIMETEKGSELNGKIDILLMSDNGLETVGGEQESTKIIINGIKGSFSVGVIQPGKVKRPIYGADFYHLTNHTRIKHLVKHPLSFIRYILNVRTIINTVNPTVIHTQAQVSFFIVALLSKLKLISPRIKLIHTERGLFTKYGRLIKQVFYFCIKELDVLVTTTEFNMKYWKDAIQKRALSLDCKIIENTAGEIFESYDKTLDSHNSDNLVIGFAGRYTEWKNWPLAVEISKKLNNLLGEKLFVNMAVGCLDQEAENDTKIMFKDLDGVLGSRFNGAINIDINAMNNFYYEIDVFILTSNYNTESFGRTLVEAMSRKTVVLTTNAGGSVEVVGNLDNVCDTSSKFVQRVIEFYEDHGIMNAEKMNNMERVKKVYSLKNNTDKHIKLYSSFLNRN